MAIFAKVGYFCIFYKNYLTPHFATFLRIWIFWLLLNKNACSATFSKVANLAIIGVWLLSQSSGYFGYIFTVLKYFFKVVATLATFLELANFATIC